MNEAWNHYNAVNHHLPSEAKRRMELAQNSGDREGYREWWACWVLWTKEQEFALDYPPPDHYMFSRRQDPMEAYLAACEAIANNDTQDYQYWVDKWSSWRSNPTP